MTTTDLRADLIRGLQVAGGLVERSRKLQRELAELTATGEALGGQVLATVDHAGRPTALTIAPRAMRKGSEEVAEAVMSAFATAHDNLVGQSQHLLTALRDDLPEPLRDPIGSDVVRQLAEHSREITRTLQTSPDPATDALQLARDLSARMLSGS